MPEFLKLGKQVIQIGHEGLKLHDCGKALRGPIVEAERYSAVQVVSDRSQWSPRRFFLDFFECRTQRVDRRGIPAITLHTHRSIGFGMESPARDGLLQGLAGE